MAGMIQRRRAEAAQKTSAAAGAARRLLHEMESDPDLVKAVPTAIEALKSLKRVAEEATLKASLAVQDQTGNKDDASNLILSAESAADKAKLVVTIARHAATLSDTPFGDDLSRRVARTLRAGVLVRQRPEDRIEVCGTHLYQGVGLSFGCVAKMDIQPFVNAAAPQDEVSFSVDSCWVGYDQEPVQHCASVSLSQPGLHMALNGLSPRELDGDTCNTLPEILRWVDEKEFICFLAMHSERSLALLLGSGSHGSITRQKMEGAAVRHEHYVSDKGLSGSTWHGDRAFACDLMPRQVGNLIPVSDGSEAMRNLANSSDALSALERAVLCFEEEWNENETCQSISGKDFLKQVLAQAETIQEQVVNIEPANLGLLREPVLGLQRDMKRQLDKFFKYVNILYDQFGFGLNEEPVLEQAFVVDEVSH